MRKEGRLTERVWRQVMMFFKNTGRKYVERSNGQLALQGGWKRRRTKYGQVSRCARRQKRNPIG
jgi:hypothetical protein